MCMANRSFQLKPSLFALGFHILIFSLILWFAYILVAWWLNLLIFFGLLLSYGYFFYQSRIQFFAYLDEKEWTLIDQYKIKQRAELEYVIDHQMYIVLYFHPMKAPVVVWRDQLSLQQWKNLKILAQLA